MDKGLLRLSRSHYMSLTYWVKLKGSGVSRRLERFLDPSGRPEERKSDCVEKIATDLAYEVLSTDLH